MNLIRHLHWSDAPMKQDFESDRPPPVLQSPHYLGRPLPARRQPYSGPSRSVRYSLFLLGQLVIVTIALWTSGAHTGAVLAFVFAVGALVLSITLIRKEVRRR